MDVPGEIWAKCSGIQRRRLTKLVGAHTNGLGNPTLRHRVSTMIAGIHAYGEDHCGMERVVKDSGSDTEADLNGWLMLAGKKLKLRHIPIPVRKVATPAQMSDIVRLHKAFNSNSSDAEASGDALIALIRRLLKKAAADAEQKAEKKKCCGAPMTEECKCTGEDEEGKQPDANTDGNCDLAG